MSSACYQFNASGLGGNINTKALIDSSAIMQSRPVVATNFRPMLFADNAEEFTRNTDYSTNSRSGLGTPLSLRAGQTFRDGGPGVIPLVQPWQTDDSWQAHHFTDNSRVMTKNDIEAGFQCGGSSITQESGVADATMRHYCIVRNRLERGGISARSGWASANTWENRVKEFERQCRETQQNFHVV